jgi:hypothetical protein
MGPKMNSKAAAAAERFENFIVLTVNIYLYSGNQSKIISKKQRMMRKPKEEKQKNGQMVQMLEPQQDSRFTSLFVKPERMVGARRCSSCQSCKEGDDQCST